ncbi:MAG: branched-chain amino acid ABC transporter permease [Acidimicrobiales bacterium]
MFAIALTAYGAPASAQESDESVLRISGTARVGRDIVEGIRYLVTLEGETIGEAVSDANGEWEVVVGEPGEYVVEIEVASIPAGLKLRDPDVTSRAIEIVDKPKGAIFALEGQIEGGDPVTETVGAGDGTFDRYVDRFMSGVRVGALVSLAAVGLSLIYGVTGLINFAHGELVMFGGVVAWTLEDQTGLPLILLAAVTIIAGGGLGFGLEKGLFQPLRRRKLNSISLVIVSIGLAFFMRYIYLIYFGSERKFFQDFRIQQNFDIGPISLPPKDYVIILVSLITLGVVGYLLQYTKLGTSMRAVSDNRDLAESSGIDVQKTILAVWIAGGALASLAGVLIGVTQQVSWQGGERQLLLIFAAVTLGGLGTAYGAMVGGMAIGIASETSTLWIDNDLKFLVALTALIVILIVRPQGILGVKERLG